MSPIDEFREKWNEMDEVDRRNFWLLVAGLILLMIVFMSINDTFSSLGNIVDENKGIANDSIHDLKDTGNMLGGKDQQAEKPIDEDLPGLEGDDDDEPSGLPLRRK
ncbi:MAG: hypothetical protein GF416_02855 [Candidatus Altiarchaeales archaeon]|nr:hypothetical protein [Candidatus Altiarchaeales archaeon]MBD3416059.1 hypothetical protein [Candidatus Altiarchaeales archaeon]